MATDTENKAREIAQTKAQQHAARVGRELGAAAAAKERTGVRATQAFTRVYNHSFPVLYEQVYDGFLRQAYAELLAEGSK
jgi:hypothetical protein